MFTYGRNVGAAGFVASLSTASLIKSGQTVSYRTDDDGDLEAGRELSFLALSGNNPYGNTKRFLDELGTEIFTNNIVIDWSTYNGSTVLGYKRTSSATAVSWNDAIDGAAALSIGSFTRGWRLPNVREMINLCNYGSASGKVLNYAPINITDWVNLWTSTTNVRLPNVREMINLCNYGSASGKVLNYAPINITDWVNLWTSTTNVETTTNAMALFDSRSGAIAQTSKAGAACHYIAVRTFTVTGTTLT